MIVQLWCPLLYTNLSCWISFFFCSCTNEDDLEFYAVFRLLCWFLCVRAFDKKAPSQMFVFLSRQELKPASKPGSRRGSLNPDSKDEGNSEVNPLKTILKRERKHIPSFFKKRHTHKNFIVVARLALWRRRSIFRKWLSRLYLPPVPPLSKRLKRPSKTWAFFFCSLSLKPKLLTTYSKDDSNDQITKLDLS